jgi:hypothetical protein
MEHLLGKVKRLQLTVAVLTGVNLFILITSYRQKREQQEKFDEISVDRINIVDKKGVTKMVIASEDMLRKDAKGFNSEGFTYSGLLFRNEEGEECGGLIYNGKKTTTGQHADAGLTFDQYNQDQVINLNHEEIVDSSEITVNDGLTILQRPDYKKKEEEYKTYEQIDKMNLLREQRDSIRAYYANKEVIGARRMFLGTSRGVKDSKPYNETGLFIKNRGGKVVMKMFVDYNNVPHFEVYEPGGKKKIYELNVKGSK